MRVALWCVEEEVADACAGDVLVFLGDVGKDYATCYFYAGPEEGRLLEVCFAEVGEAEQPEDGVGNLFEDAQPGAEGCGLDLVGIRQ